MSENPKASLMIFLVVSENKSIAINFSHAAFANIITLLLNFFFYVEGGGGVCCYT